MKTETVTIESKGYVATEADIEKLAEQQSNHINASRWQLPATYLRALIATTQGELGIKSIKRNPPRPSDEELTRHLKALAEVQERFYAAVQRGAAKAAMDSEDTRDKQSIIASRCVFARTSYSTVRNWILRGRFGLEGLNPKHATKRQLYEATPRPERIGGFRTAALTKQAERMLGAIKEQAKTNRESAIEALQAIINALSRGFDDLGLPAIDIREAVDHTATGVIQAAADRLRERAERVGLASSVRARGRPPNPPTARAARGGAQPRAAA